MIDDSFCGRINFLAVMLKFIFHVKYASNRESGKTCSAFFNHIQLNIHELEVKLSQNHFYKMNLNDINQWRSI